LRFADSAVTDPASYFMVSAPKGFHPILNNGELASIFSIIFIYFVFSGPGASSLDANPRPITQHCELASRRMS
jgi:uncharacterized membrane protein YphA (DoxX/SURF4 family)